MTVSDHVRMQRPVYSRIFLWPYHNLSYSLSMSSLVYTVPKSNIDYKTLHSGLQVITKVPRFPDFLRAQDHCWPTGTITKIYYLKTWQTENWFLKVGLLWLCKWLWNTKLKWKKKNMIGLFCYDWHISEKLLKPVRSVLSLRLELHYRHLCFNQR